MIGYKWAVFWLVALCAFRYLVNLSWVESICIVIALIIMFVGTEWYNRSHAGRCPPHDHEDA